ncbi:MAG: AmmeMemoRadiSam system protein B [Planctomycetes bacterium]|nr:AmmeMemoRadiSam system protein B [Planctomycetota bacterium]
MIRRAAYAGSWYPEDADELRETLAGFFESDPPERKSALGVMTPHAGYVYSGKIAARTFASAQVPDVALILAFSHRPYRRGIFLAPREDWETPLGTARINEYLFSELALHAEVFEIDGIEHESEHSAELQVPFLQFENPKIEICAVNVNTRDKGALAAAAKLIADAISSYDSRLSARGQRGKVLIVASSDMSHEFHSRNPLARANSQDSLALEALLTMDVPHFLETIESHDVTMCGVGPVATLMHVCNILERPTAEIVCRGTSSDVSPSKDRVVGYAGVRFGAAN